MNPRYLSSAAQGHLGSNSAWPVLAGRWHYLILSPKPYFVTPPRWQPSLQTDERALGVMPGRPFTTSLLFSVSFPCGKLGRRMEKKRKNRDTDPEDELEQDPRIVNGTLTKRGDSPWQVRARRRDSLLGPLLA